MFRLVGSKLLHHARAHNPWMVGAVHQPIQGIWGMSPPGNIGSLRSLLVVPEYLFLLLLRAVNKAKNILIYVNNFCHRLTKTMMMSPCIVDNWPTCMHHRDILNQLALCMNMYWQIAMMLVLNHYSSSCLGPGPGVYSYVTVGETNGKELSSSIQLTEL